MKIYPVFIPHAGCPHRCLFCAQDRSTGHADIPSADGVRQWLETVLPAQSDGEIAFYGGTFTALPQEQQALYLDTATCHLDSGRVSGIRLSTRPDALDPGTLDRLSEAGVTTIEIGCQSFNDNVLAVSGRGHAAIDNIRSVQACLAAGFQVGAQLPDSRHRSSIRRRNRLGRECWLRACWRGSESCGRLPRRSVRLTSMACNQRGRGATGGATRVRGTTGFLA